MTCLYLIRHAHADWSPDENRPLSSKGRLYAVRLAEVLAGIGISLIISSPALRAIQTVQPLADRLGLTIRTDPRLREREFGQWNAGTFEEAVCRTWEDMDFAYPNGENNHTAQTRALQALDEILKNHPRDHVLISTHGNLLALMLRDYLPRVDFAFWQHLTMPDAYHLEVRDASVIRFSRLWQEET